MTEMKRQYEEEFKTNAVKHSYANPKTVKQIADDLGTNENRLYMWRKKNTADGGKTRMTAI